MDISEASKKEAGLNSIGNACLRFDEVREGWSYCGFEYPLILQHL